ncbi:MAG: TetR/AcrR family transcriptional regulator [Raineya sp.]
MSTTIKVNINEKIYLRDPEMTVLGRKIIEEGILLIDEIGFEAFTFKKLAQKIDSTEASVYRYFENKHNFLIYVVNMYWSWISYQIDYETNNILDPFQRLKVALRVISSTSSEQFLIKNVSKEVLHRIVVSESPKAYHTKNVDRDNQEGFFKSYKLLCKKLAEMIKAIFPDYPYPFALSSTILETSHLQVHFAKHLPSLTEVRVVDNDYSSLIEFLELIILHKK